MQVLSTYYLQVILKLLFVSSHCEQNEVTHYVIKPREVGSVVDYVVQKLNYWFFPPLHPPFPCAFPN